MRLKECKWGRLLDVRRLKESRVCVGKKFDSELKERRMIQTVPSSWGYIFVATGLRRHGGQGPKNQLLMIVKTKGLAIRGSEKLVNVAREGELDRGLTRWHGPPETHLDVVLCLCWRGGGNARGETPSGMLGSGSSQ